MTLCPSCAHLWAPGSGHSNGHQLAPTKEWDTKEWLEQANQWKCQQKTEAWYFLCLLSTVNRQGFLFPGLKSCHFNRLFSWHFFSSHICQ